MRPLILLLIVLGQGCLLAPSRPGGGDDGDDGPSDCVPTDATLGVSAAAALESPTRDTLVRAAHTAGHWYLYLYPSTTKTSRCPQRQLQLEGDIDSIDAIEPAIVTGTTPDLLVLASFTNGDSAVIDVRSTGGILAEMGRVVASGYRPIAVPTPGDPEPTGFIGLRMNDELWFGGGNQGIAVASVPSGIVGTAQVKSAEAVDGWYQAVPMRNPFNGKDFILIGASAVYSAVSDPAGILTTLNVELGNCSAPPACPGRRAFSVASTTDPAEVFTIDRTDGLLTTVRSSSTVGPFIDEHMPMELGPGQVLDAAIGALFGDDKTDVAMLWGTAAGPRELIVYDAMLANPNASVASRRTFDAQVNRVEVVRTGGASHILLLSDDPRRESESCLVLNGATLEDCP